MALAAEQIGFTPDLGLLPFSDHFLTEKNSLLLVVNIVDLPVSPTSEELEYTGLVQPIIDVAGTPRIIPSHLLRQMSPGRKKIVYWETGDGGSGNFKFFPESPAVF